MEEVNIKEFFTYLKKYIVIYLLVGVAAIAGIFFYDKKVKTPIYQSTAKVVLVQQNENNSNTSSAVLNDVTVSQKLTSTYSEIAKSELVLDKVISELKLNTTPKELNKNITVSSIESTTILNISVKDVDPKNASLIANKIADVFTAEITKIYNLDNVSMLDAAKVVNTPVNDTLKRDMIIAAVLSVFGVTGIAFLLFCLDDTVKHRDDIEAQIGLPVAGKIIDGADKRRKRDDNGLISKELIVEDQPKSVVSESIKNLRTNLQFTAVDKDIKTILVTSSNAGEGKSYVSSNLAISFVQTGKRVLIIDCDLRKGRLHKIFRIPNAIGLSNLLTDEILNAPRYIQRTNIKNLDILPRGSYPPNPSELLSSNKNKALIQRLKANYDVIIFDGTPCNGLADSLIMSTLADEVLIVARESETKKAELSETKTALEKVEAKIAGVVINRVNKKSGKYYYYYGEK